MMGENERYHEPVMLRQSVEGLITNDEGVYVDATFGGGGHSREVLSVLRQNGRLIAFDRDPEAAGNAPDDPRFKFISGDFRHLKNSLRFIGVTAIDGLLADLGVSSHQFDEAGRGFSIRLDGPLDMRMDTASPLTAAKVVNEYDRDELIRILREYGEVPAAHRVADAIVDARNANPLKTTDQLVDAVRPLFKGPKINRFLAQVFQAVRLEVNGEMEALKDLLNQSAQVVKPGGRLVVISYHSLEDRPVKRFMKTGGFTGEMKKDFHGNPLRPFVPMKGMPLVPTEEEIEKNNRARSAKLRIATRNEQPFEIH
ncbi:MAG TPA: 16S rRNA (cytosine(1402)-N(4))-methyltransferase RsmH [Cryomorphaceae bacterium]|nr:16S rRNA (cytosine(1402)-N(4))-methyltransferase RsmH [Cryomorphaceae bacterium]